MLPEVKLAVNSANDAVRGEHVLAQQRELRIGRPEALRPAMLKAGLRGTLILPI